MIAQLETTQVRQEFRGGDHKVTAWRAVRSEWIEVGDEETSLVGPGDWVVHLNRRLRFVLPDSVFRVIYKGE